MPEIPKFKVTTIGQHTWIDLKPVKPRRPFVPIALAGCVIAFLVLLGIVSPRRISSRDTTFDRFETSPVNDIHGVPLNPFANAGWLGPAENHQHRPL